MVLPERGGVSQRSGSEWKVASYVLETMEQYPRKCCFEVFGTDPNAVAAPADPNAGFGAAPQAAPFPAAASAAPAPAAAPAPEAQAFSGESNDDLPF